ncbi:phosphatase PAP2 family protein [Psychromonas sp. MME2]|uniref:phosphatase PAP2 family protein n=1 Tax=unclassified Psychromonas TaxID=2614957 RepID=UPI00339CD337
MFSRYIGSFLILMVSTIPVAHALSDKKWENISDIGVYSLLGTALALPAVRDDWEGTRQAGYSILLASGVTFVGKALINEERPDKSDNDSFPSGHTTRAFASATTLHRRYGWEIGFPAYAVASLTGGARVAADKHYWHDVLAGAAIGIASGWFFTDAYDDQVQLTPWVDTQGVGLNLTMYW